MRGWSRFLFGVAMSIVIGIWALVADHTIKPPEISDKPRAVEVSDIALGDVVYLDASFYAVNSESHERMIHVQAVGDHIEFKKMYRARKICAVENGQKATVVKAGIGDYVVKLSVPPNKGEQLFCPAEMAHKDWKNSGQ